MLCELETDKVSVEVPAPASGRLTEILPTKAARCRPAASWRVIAAGGSSALAGDVATRETPAEAKPGDVARQGGGAPRDAEDGPAARKAMAEAGLTRDRVTGTGRDGRVMKEDVRAPWLTVRPPAPAARPPEPAPGPGAARARPGRGCRARGTGEDDPPAPDHRAAVEGCAEHRRDADHL
jgi:2-oxoglutarate dehydrogenase E2 component (dihydrolipoamide succinyltransferase)